MLGFGHWGKEEHPQDEEEINVLFPAFPLTPRHLHACKQLFYGQCSQGLFGGPDPMGLYWGSPRAPCQAEA